MEPVVEIICPAWYANIEKLTEALPLLAEQGVTAIEIGIESADYFERHDSSKLRTLVGQLGACGIRARSVHSPFGPNLDISCLDDRTHENGVDRLIDSIEFAGMLGAGTVIVHAGDKLDEPRGGRLERAHGVLRELSVVARESGVVLALENLPPDYLGHTPDEVLALLDGIDPDSLGVCFDCGHANLSGRFAEFAEALLPHAVVIHVHDNDAGSDQHRFPGAGTIDWRAFAESFRAGGADAAIVLECKPPEGMIWAEAFQKLREALE